MQDLPLSRGGSTVLGVGAGVLLPTGLVPAHIRHRAAALPDRPTAQEHP